jgi:hypothetical protein
MTLICADFFTGFARDSGVIAPCEVLLSNFGIFGVGK